MKIKIRLSDTFRMTIPSESSYPLWSSSAYIL